MSHQIYWRDPDGSLMTVLANFSRLEYARAENKVGVLTLDLYPDQVDYGLLRQNMRLEPWRQVGAYSPYLDGESAFFLQKWGWAVDARGGEIVRLTAHDANFFLDHHIIAYTAGSANAEMTNQADDMAKDLVRQNLGGDATDTARDLSAWLTVQVDFTAGPSITKGFSRRNVLSTLQDICQESYQQGTYLAFDTVYTGPGTMEFRTYTGQRGIDHGQNGTSRVVVSRSRHNLEEPEYIEDHIEESNYIYAGGQGVEADRIVKTASAVDALGLNRRELWVDARLTNNTEAVVQSEANAALYQHRARKTLTGKLIDTEGCQYGVHYNFGDLVFAEYKAGFDAHINAIHVTVDQAGEALEIYLRGEA